MRLSHRTNLCMHWYVWAVPFLDMCRCPRIHGGDAGQNAQQCVLPCAVMMTRMHIVTGISVTASREAARMAALRANGRVTGGRTRSQRPTCQIICSMEVSVTITRKRHFGHSLSAISKAASSVSFLFAVCPSRCSSLCCDQRLRSEFQHLRLEPLCLPLGALCP